MTIFVKTEDDLKNAIQNKAPEIIVSGDLADKLHKANQKIGTAKKAGIFGVIAGIALIPFTGGGSAVMGVGAAATASGAGVSSILLGIGFTVGVLGFVYAMNKNYSEVEYSVGILKLKLKK